MKLRSMIVGSLLIMEVCFGSAFLYAENVPAKPWTDKAEVSYVNASGNTTSRTTSAKNSYYYGWTRTSLDVIASALGSNNDEGVTAEQYNASEKFAWNFTERNYVFEKFEWDKNRFSGIKNRYNSSAGLGRELLKTTKSMLILELGAGYVEEKRYLTDSNNFMSGRAYTKFTQALSSTASFMQDAEYLHNFKDPDGYQATTNSELVASVSTHISLKLGYQWKFNNVPAPGYEKTDTITTVALIINY